MNPPNEPRVPRPSGARKRGWNTKASKLGSEAAQHGYFKSFDGTRLFYSVEGTGKPLIFCYGLVCSSLHWTYQIEAFKSKYQTVWMDYRGHQNSDTPEDLNSLTLETLARDLAALMDELKIKDAVFLGHSMGVNVVLEFYHLFPERVAGLILSNGTASRPLETLLGSNKLQPGFDLLNWLEHKSPTVLNWFWKLQKANPFAQKMIGVLGFNPHLTPPEDIALYVDQIADLDPRVFLRLIKSYDSYDGSTWLHTVKAPTLIIAGELDHVLPLPNQELLHQLIPGSELCVVKRGSHCPQMDLPDFVNLKIAEFLGKFAYVSSPKEGSSTPSD